MAKSYIHVEVQTLADGTVRVYGNGGLVFETQGTNLTISSSIYQKERPHSGEFVVKKDNVNTNV